MARIGRPSKYDVKFVKVAQTMCKLGATDEEVAEAIGVSVPTLNSFKCKYPDFLASLKAGKEIADNRVERSLYTRAVGYTYDSEKVFQFQGEVVRADTKEHVPPDTTAMIFWLKNRRPEEWRDKQDVNMNVTTTEVEFK